MNWVTVVWSMIAAACLTIAGVHLPFWIRNRTAWPSFFFSWMAMATAAYAFCELRMLQANAFLAQCEAEATGCVIADLRMPGLSGLEFQAALARTHNPLPLLFLTGQGDIASSVRAMRGGAEDFLEKRASRQELLDAVQRALARDAREREQRARRQSLQARFGRLSERELEILSHVLQGRLNKQIADDLGINERTVKLHRSAVMAKVEVHSVAELAQLAREAGLG